MFANMITYDSEYGDAIVFDDFNFSAQSNDELIDIIARRFDELIKNRTLIVDRESSFSNVVETRSGRTAESYILTYPSEKDSMDGVNGLLLADSIFYDPDSKEISCGLDAFTFWDRLCDQDDDVIEAWGLSDIIENQPPQLGGTHLGPGGGLQGWELTKFLFNLYKSRLAEK